MRYGRRMLAVLLMVLPGLAAAQLGSSDRIVAQVPFDFMVANKIVPAGKCVVQLTAPGAKMLTINNQEARLTLISRAFEDENRKAASVSTLVFRKYGSQYFLRGIKPQGSQIVYRLPESKAEAELRAQNVTATNEVLLASLQ